MNKDKPAQGALFDKEDYNLHACNTEWQGMPEFNMPKDEYFCKIEVKFASRADFNEFKKRLEFGSKVNPKTVRTWWPFREAKRPREWAYFNTKQKEHGDATRMSEYVKDQKNENDKNK